MKSTSPGMQKDVLLSKNLVSHYCLKPQCGRCFRNAQDLVVSMQDEYAVSYVEGFFFEPTKCEPLFHAWVESGGMAIDPTCPEYDGEEYIPALHIEPSVVSSLRCELGLPLS